METETETDTDEDMEIEPMVFEVTEIDLDYEFDAARWYDFTREEFPMESRVAELWFETALSCPPSRAAYQFSSVFSNLLFVPSNQFSFRPPFAIKLLTRDDKNGPLSICEDGKDTSDVLESDGEICQQSQCLAIDVNETGNGMTSGVFNFIQGGNLKNVPNQSLPKGPTFSNRKQTDKLKCQPKSSTRPRSSTLMKPTASQLAKQDNARLRMQVDQIKEKGLCPSGSEIQASKRQKLDGGLLHKVAEATTQEMNFVHKALKKDRTLERNSQFSRTKITVPRDPDFATSHRANRIGHKDDSKLDKDSTSVYRFRARPLNRKILEAPSLPIRKKSTPKLPEFQEFRLKTSERAMQHSSAVSTSSYHGYNYHKGSDKPDTTAFNDGVNREPRRSRAKDIPKDNDRKHIFKARPLDDKIVSSGRDIHIFRKSKQETTVPLTQTQECSLHSEKRTQPDLPTDLFSKLSIKSELQTNNGSRLRFPRPEQVKGSKENSLNSFQAGNERTSKVTEKPTVQRGIWTTRKR